ncbi:MMPL family transporter [Pseudoalteromonas luteoviolacea]|uniref:efflux RND transporter permease subunit n=1 Tax=Pseudoalteromonas luteoviolacea TaxID=43657 RepID=UPI001B37B83B|nr:MMPL family transporter [Pseudoalteromonas luteoviolacea]MBQ4812250.1 MMPL family transporter [Pseudoalteromonas luteoviolacea]
MDDLWHRRILNYPKTWIVICLVLIAGATVGAGNLYFRGDYQIFFDDTNTQLYEFQKIESIFNKSDLISIVMAPKQEDIFTPQTLSLIRELTERAWQVPYSSRVDSIANYQHTFAEQDDLVVLDLMPPEMTFTDGDIASVKQVALSEPALRQSLLSQSGKVAVINITVQLPEADNTEKMVEVKEYVNQLISEYQANYPDMEFHQAGIVAMNYAFMLSSQEDFATLVPAMLLLVMVFLGIALRSVAAVIYTLVVIVGAVLATLGLAGWLGFFLSTPTVNVPTMILTIAVADCVHMLASVRHYMRQGHTKQQAIAKSLEQNWMPITITSVTTALGFILMNSLDVPVIRDLGNLSALGVILAGLLSLTLLPAMLSVLPFRVAKVSASRSNDRYDRFALWVIRHNKVLGLGAFIVVIGSAFSITKNQVNDEAVKYFSTQSEFRQAADFMAENISGMSSLSVAINSGSEQGISSPEFVAMLGKATDWLRVQPEIHHVQSLADTLKRLNKNMHNDDERYHTLPQDQALAAQYLLLYEMSLPYGLDLNNQLNLDKSSLKLQLTIDNLGSKEMVELENRLRVWFEQNAPQYSVMISSPTLMFAHIGERNMQSMLQSLPMALLLISVLLVFSLRSLRLGLISLIPNMIPAIIGFGIWGLYSGEINLGLSVVVTLTLGIVVDDTVHFLSKYQNARRLGQSAEQAIRYAFITVGRALVVTSAVLVAGFALLGTSDFRLNSDMGQLSALVIFIALLVDFILLPCILLWFDKYKYAQAHNNDEAHTGIAINNPQTNS